MVRPASRRGLRPRMEALEERTTPSGLVVGAPAGSPPVVQVLDDAGAVIHSFLAYSPSFRGGVNVAQGDLNGDGRADIVTAPARGRGPVEVFDGSTYALIGEFSPSGDRYAGGVNLAVGQVVAGGADQIITGTASGRTVVKVFDGTSFAELRAITPYGRGVSGVNVVVANLDGGSVSDIVTAPAQGGPPVVKSFDGSTGREVGSFLAYDAHYRGGVQIASGDFNGNNVPDLVTAPADVGRSLVRVWASSPTTRMISEFVATPGGVPRWAQTATLGVVDSAGDDEIAVTSKFATRAFGNAARPVSVYDVSGAMVGSVALPGVGRGTPDLSSASSPVFPSYAGPKEYAVAYNPTWPNWSPTAAPQLNDSDFFTTAFQGLWGVDPTTGQGRRDLATFQAAGFNLLRLYNWGPSRGWNGTSGNAHIPFLDQAQALGLKVIVPVSDYFLGDDQYAWNGRNPDSSFSFGSAPQGIQDDLMQFISSITKNGAPHPAVQSISIGNEMDLGIDNDPGTTAKLQRAEWWVVNLHDQLLAQFGQNVPTPFLTIPISNADQGNGGSNKSWFQIFDHGVQAGDASPLGAVPGGSFTSSVQGLSSYSWYTTWFYNSVNMFQSGAQLSATLQQYDTGVASGPTWSQQWPGEKLPVPLMVTELGTTRFNTTQDAQYNAVANDQAQVATNVLATSTNLMGSTIFEANDEPNKNNYTGPPSSETFFGAATYNTSPDQTQFRNGTLMYSLNTGATPWIGGTLPNYTYPVYQLFPVTSSSGTTLFSKLKSIFAQVP